MPSDRPPGAPPPSAMPSQNQPSSPLQGAAYSASNFAFAAPSAMPSPNDSADGTPPPDESYDLQGFGRTGLHRYGGFVYEETHPRLEGSKGVRVYREMADNDSTIGAVLYTIESLARNVEWRIEPSGKDAEAQECAEFVESALEDMSHTWEDLISEILSMYTYGWALFEITYKRREGPDGGDSATNDSAGNAATSPMGLASAPTKNDASAHKSHYADGKLGWRKIAIRSQDSLLRWEFAPDGGLRGMWQQAPPDYQVTYLPIEKCVLFRPKAPRNNPEGRSMLRNAFRSWWLLKRLQEIEAVGIERDLSGLPMIEVPPEFLMSSATPAQKSFVAAMQKMVQQLKRDEREGVIAPSPELTDSAGVLRKTGFKLSLLSTGGRRAIDTNATIMRYEQRIAMTLLCEFLFLGMDKTGSFALADSKTEMFAEALGAMLDVVSSTFTKYAIHKLCRLNGYPREAWPSLVHGDIKAPDLDKLGNYFKNLVSSGIIRPDDALERKAREMANLPQVDAQRDLLTNEPPPASDPAVDAARRDAAERGAGQPVQQPGQPPATEAEATNAPVARAGTEAPSMDAGLSGGGVPPKAPGAKAESPAPPGAPAAAKPSPKPPTSAAPPAKPDVPDDAPKKPAAKSLVQRLFGRAG